MQNGTASISNTCHEHVCYPNIFFNNVNENNYKFKKKNYYKLAVI